MKEVRFHPRVLRQIRSLPTSERRRVGRRIAEAQRLIGQPHLHKGVGLRKLRDGFFELRSGLKDRLVFEETAEAIIFECFGDHDAIRAFLKNR